MAGRCWRSPGPVPAEHGLDTMSGNTEKPTTSAVGGEHQPVASRRAILGAAVALPLATAPAGGEAAELHPNDATLLRLEREIAAINAEQDRLEAEDEAMGNGTGKHQSARYQAIRARTYALSDRWHAAHEKAIDTPAATDAGRRSKARIVLRWVKRDADGWPIGEDGLAWSLARDVLGIAEGPALEGVQPTREPHI